MKKENNNIDKKYEWDLEYLLKNQTIESLVKKWSNKMETILKAYPDIFKTFGNFKKWLTLNEEVKIIGNHLFNYTSNKNNENLADQKWIALSQELSILSNQYSTKMSDYENRIYQNENKVKEYLKHDDLKEYQRSFDNILKFKKHNLSNECEELLSKLAVTEDGVENMFSSIIDSEIKFDDAFDSKKKVHKINKQVDAIVNMKSFDRQLRKTSWISFNKAFYNFKNTLTYALYNNYLSLNTHAKIRKFKDYVSSTCFADEIDIKLIPHIYKQVKEYKDIYKKFSEHRKTLLCQLLKIKEIEPWDTNVDLVKIKKTYSIEEAKKIAIVALAPMGKEYLHNVQKAFDKRWISWLPKNNKYSGAYSIGGTKGLDKFYILMNYDKTLSSIFTLVHEMGHSMNSYYYSKQQKIYASITIFCAEIASITNEMLLNYYLLEKYQNDEKMRLFILDELISGFFATTTRQIIFSNFEWIANEKINNNESLTYDFIAKTYLDLMIEYMGVKDPKKYEKEPYLFSLVTPLRIPHFYAGNFYVYKYAIGQVVACIVAKRIINKEKGFLELYKKFLSSGTSMNPIETIKILGIDLYDAKPWQEAKTIMSDFIKEYLKIKKV